jgi:hypothetical protein
MAKNPLNCEVAGCDVFATQSCCGKARCDHHMVLHMSFEINALRDEVARLKALAATDDDDLFLLTGKLPSQARKSET